MGRYNSCLQISKRTSCAWQSTPVLCWIQGQDKSRLVKIKRKEVGAEYEGGFPDGKNCQAKEHWLEQSWIASSWKLSYWCWRVICQGWFSMNKRFENMTNKSSSSSLYYSIKQSRRCHPSLYRSQLLQLNFFTSALEIGQFSPPH